MDLEQFLQLLSNELESDNQVRSTAEKTYMRLLAQNVPLVVHLHIQHLLSPSTTCLKSLSLIHMMYIYKIFDKSNLVFPQEITELVCGNLLSLFAIPEFGENEKANVIFVIAYIGAFYIERDIFVELPNQILTICKDFSNPRCSWYMACLSQIIMRLPNYELQINAADAIVVVSSCFSTEACPVCSIAAVKILFALVTNQNVGFDQSLVALAPNIPELLQRLEGDRLYQMLSDINVFISLYSSFFSETMPTMIESLLTIAANQEVEEQCRTRAISATTTFVERESHLCVDFINDIITVFIGIGCEITEDDWTTMEEDITLSDFALDKLGTLFLISSISKQTIEVAMEAVRQLLQTETWETTHTALVTLVKIISADPAQSAASLEEIVTIILQNMSNEAPMCRSAAAKAMSCANAMYKSSIQSAYHESIVSTYLEVIKSDEVPQSLADIILSLSQYCQECSSSTILQSCEPILETIQPLIESEDPKIQSYVLLCVNVFAAKLKAEFSEFYPTMAQCVSQILPAEISPEATILRATAIEMVSLMGYCTDAETYAADADACMQVFVKWDFDTLTFNEYEKLMATFSTIAKLTPAVFLQYIDGIFMYLYNDATTTLRPAIHKEFANEYRESKDITTYYFNNTIIEVNSCDNIKRCATISALGTLLETLGHEEEFCQYMGRTKKAIADNLFNFFYRNLVETSISCLFKFFDIFASEPSEENIAQLRKFGEKFISMMKKVLESTIVPSVIACAIKHIRLAIRILVEHEVFTQPTIIRELLLLVPKFDEANSKLTDPNYQIMIDGEYGNLITLWFELFTEDAVALFEEIKEVYPLEESEPRLLAIELWVDFYVYTDINEENLHSQLIAAVFNGCGHDSPFMMVNCFLCMGRLIKKAQFFEETIQEAIATILTVVDDVISQRVVDAGMIALGIILMNSPELKDREQALMSWIEHFPILTRYDDTDACYEFFISVIENNTIEITQPLLAKLVNIIAQLYETNIINGEVMEHFKALIGALRENGEICPVFDACVEEADLSEKQKIMCFLQ